LSRPARARELKLGNIFESRQRIAVAPRAGA